MLPTCERPRPAFWLFSVLGACLIGGYALSQGSSGPALGDFLMLGAIVTCGLGYAEGARLSRKLGGWQVISWALVFSVPVMLPLTIIEMPSSWHEIGFGAWIGLAYVSIFSMLVGFVFWYRGLDQGGVAAVAQLQLLQPFLGLALAAWLLHEPVTPLMQVTAAAVVLCVAGARKFAPNSPSTPRGAGAVPQSPAADDASPRRGAGGTGRQATTTNTPRPDQAS